MRLTLRTLLAYRDRVLSAEDQADLHRRIQENPHIANLLRRMDELSQGQKILSPKLDESGVGEPNIAAEYLDDVLTNDLVAELERLCLEKAEYLSELANCHNLLAEAMQKQVAVPKALQAMALGLAKPDEQQRVRERLASQSQTKSPIDGQSANTTGESLASTQELKDTAVADSSASLDVNVQAPMVASGGETIKHAGLNLEDKRLATEVPEYLIAAGGQRWQLPAAVAVMASLLLLMLWYTLGSLDTIRELWNDSGSREPLARVEEAAKAAAVTEAERLTDATLPAVASPPTPVDSESNRKPIGADPSLTLDNGAVAVDPVAADPVAADPDVPTGELSAPIVDQAAADNGELRPAPVDPIAKGSVDDPIKEFVDQGEESTPQMVGIRWEPSSSAEKQAVVLIQSPSQALRQMNEDSLASNGDRLIVPSPVHTTFSLQPWYFTLAGPSLFDVSTESDRIQLATALFRGMLSCERPDVPLLLKTPAGEFSISALHPQVWIAVEVAYRPVQRGSLLETGSVSPVLIAVGGTDGDPIDGPIVVIRALDSDDSQVIESTGLGIASIGQEPLVEFTLNNPPRWYGKRSVRHIDQEASADFSLLLQNVNSINVQQISGMARDRRPEVAALAIQTSMLLGDWNPMASELLRADRLRSHWFSSLSLARQLLAADPSAAERLLEELSETYGDEGPDLANLVLGFEREQQTAEGLGQLIRRLESDSLPMRVVAAFEMLHLTGQDHGFLPHSPARASIQQFRRQLSTGRLTIPPVGDPIWERTIQP